MQKNEVKCIYDIINKTQSTITVSKSDFAIINTHFLQVYVNSMDSVSLPYSNIEKNRIQIIGEITYLNKLNELTQIAKAFSEMSIDYRILKGIGIAITYPYPSTRLMSDFDILIRNDDYVTASAILKNLGYYCDFYDPQKVDLCFHKEKSTDLELHNKLFDYEEFELFRDLEEEIWLEPETITFFDVQLKFPKPSIHIKYQIVHMIKHFQARGSGLRFLLDLKWFSRFYNLSLESMIPYFQDTTYELFFHTLLGMMNRYMDIELVIDNKQLKCSEVLVDRMAEYIIENGTYGNSDSESITDFRYLKYKRIARYSKLKMLKKLFFPDTHELDDHFLYAKKYAFLLPIAWIHRIIYAIFSNKYSLKEKGFIFTKNNYEVNKRIKLLNDLDLIK